MDLAVRYAKLNGLGEKELAVINYIRLKKKVYLPFELVGSNGRSHTECYEEINCKSQIEWGFMNEISGNISKGQKRIWTNFLH